MLECKICGFKSNNLSSHIKYKHNLSSIQYKEKYNVEYINLNFIKQGHSWNKGLTKETDISVKKYTEKQKKTKASKEYKNSQQYKNQVAATKKPERNKKISEKRKEYWSNPNNKYKHFSQIEKMRKSLVNSETLKTLDRATKPELLFMLLLEKNKIKYEFQKSIDDRFICDFFIVDKNIIVEINGPWHNSINDNLRKTEFEKLGYNVKMFYIKRKNEKTFNEFILSLK